MSLRDFWGLASLRGCRVELSNRMNTPADATVIGVGRLHGHRDELVGAIGDLGGRIISTLDERVLLRFPNEAIVSDIKSCSVDHSSHPFRNRLVGARYVVDFLDPNLVKPFRLGHLRNVALAWSIKSLAQFAGAQVRTQAIACDFGRAIGEAMAGVATRGEVWPPAPAPSEPGDEHVGAAYTTYVSSRQQNEYPTMCLRRDDGFPTQHLRALAVWSGLWSQLTNTTVVHIYGEEWHHATLARLEALCVAGLALDDVTYIPVRYANVVLGSADRMGSSLGNAVTVTSLLDRGSDQPLAARFGLLLVPPGDKVDLDRAFARGVELVPLLGAIRPATPEPTKAHLESARDRSTAIQILRLMDLVDSSIAQFSPRHLLKWLNRVSAESRSEHRDRTELELLGVRIASSALGLPA